MDFITLKKKKNVMKQQTNNNTDKQTVTEVPLKIEPLKKKKIIILLLLYEMMHPKSLFMSCKTM